jgi:hypothetical protein
LTRQIGRRRVDLPARRGLPRIRQHRAVRASLTQAYVQPTLPSPTKSRRGARSRVQSVRRSQHSSDSVPSPRRQMCNRVRTFRSGRNHPFGQSLPPGANPRRLRQLSSPRLPTPRKNAAGGRNRLTPDTSSRLTSGACMSTRPLVAPRQLRVSDLLHETRSSEAATMSASEPA